MPPTDIAIIGGGASGLAAAIAAARAGARVCVLERDVEAGLPILATGNGRCNLSNTALDPARYRHPEAFRAVAGSAPEAAVAAFFEDLGLLVAEEAEGRLYPVTRRATSVRDVLLSGGERAGVLLRPGCTVAGAAYDAGRGLWTLSLREPATALRAKPGRDARTSLRNRRRALAAAELAERSLEARCVIIACGGTAAPVATLFGLPCLPEEPVLCPLACQLAVRSTVGATLEGLDGLRVEGALTLVRDGEAIWCEEGEVLFRTYGLSGIAAFNLSRRVQPGRDLVEVDLFPELSPAELDGLLRRREQLLGPLAAADAKWFDGMAAPELGAVVHGALQGADDPVARTAVLLKHLPFEILGLAQTEQAQTRRGGIPLDALSLETLALKPALAPALFACGAALDMDADCGGYNLAWAWLSGLRAGASAAHAACATQRTALTPSQPETSPHA